MAHVPKEMRGNLLAYLVNIREGMKKEEIKDAIMKLETQVQQAGFKTTYNKENLARLSRVSGGVALAMAIRSRRYDDLFEDFMEYFDKNDVIPKTPADLEPALDKVLFGKLAKSKQGLLRAFRQTKTAQEYFSQIASERVSKTRATLFRTRVPEQSRERYDELVKKKLVYKIYNPRLKREQLIYEDKLKKRTAFRDFKTGRFAPNPIKTAQKALREL